MCQPLHPSPSRRSISPPRTHNYLDLDVLPGDHQATGTEVLPDDARSAQQHPTRQGDTRDEQRTGGSSRGAAWAALWPPLEQLTAKGAAGGRPRTQCATERPHTVDTTYTP
eukprot:scaffold52983_cov74-Phaeocystis_antarctica.AAC.2